MKKFRNTLFLAAWLIIVLLASNTGVLVSIFSPEEKEQERVEEDPFMTTGSYQVSLKVEKDNSYMARETIAVRFDEYRHGIYRYIPDRGRIVLAKEGGEPRYIPYYADVDLIMTNEKAQTEEENGNQVFRFGDEDQTVTGGVYDFAFHYRPVTQEGYEDFYYNIFPTGWQNEIPAGSSFVIRFPEEFPHELLEFYCGSYGEQKAGEDVLTLSWDKNTVTGVLTESLPVGSGLTGYADMPEGYFTDVTSAKHLSLWLAAVPAVILAVILLLFFLLGRDEPVYPSIQYYPPDDLDSAAVGYIVDGSVSDQEVISLIVYWADKGYMKILEDKGEKITFVKMKDLPENAPDYERKIFDGIFGKKAAVGKQRELSSLKYRFAQTLSTAKEQVKKYVKKNGGVYTTASVNARWISVILSLIPSGLFLAASSACSVSFEAGYLILWIVYGVSVLLLCLTVDQWYSRKQKSRKTLVAVSVLCLVTGLAGMIFAYLHNLSEGRTFRLLLPLAVMTAVSAAASLLAAFMKKRTSVCVRRMGYLMGLREFIETAELERIQMMAAENPQWFYHILPYAYVFGLSDVWIGKFEEIAVPAPDWYVNSTGRLDMFDLYVFHRCMTHNLHTIQDTLSAPKPQSSSSGSGGGFSGGGGGGFSGGGFSGGGGGSW